MRKFLRLAVLTAAVVALAVFVAGCGSKDKSSSGSTTNSNSNSGSSVSKSYDNGTPEKGGAIRIVPPSLSSRSNRLARSRP